MGQCKTMRAGTGQWEHLVQPILAGRLKLCVCPCHQAQQLHSDDGGGLAPECAAGIKGGWVKSYMVKSLLLSVYM